MVADITRQFLDRIHDIPGENNRWVGGWLIGRGGGGKVGLWLKQDANDNVEDQCVIKLVTWDHAEFKDPSNWMTYRNNLGRNVRVPREARIQQILTEAGYNSIVRYRGARFRTGLPKRAKRNASHYRIYMDFAPHRTLWHLINEHRRPDLYVV